MKKFVVVLFAGLFSSAVMAVGVMEFEGRVAAQTCTVTVNGIEGSVTVPMPTVAPSALQYWNSTAGHTRFTIELTHCSYQGSKVFPRFVGNNLHSTGALQNLSGPGYAQNVGLAIGVLYKYFIHLGDFSTDPFLAIPLQVTGNERYGSQEYYVRYVALDFGGVTPGKVRGSVQYAIVYL